MVAHRRTGWAATVSTGATVTDRLVDMSRPDRVTSDPAICHGQPIICGLRYPVESLLGLLASGMTIEEVVDEYPDLERDDPLGALEFGARYWPPSRAAVRRRLTPAL